MKTFVYMNPDGSYETEPYFFKKYNSSIYLDRAKIFYDRAQLKNQQKALEVEVKSVPRVNVYKDKLIHTETLPKEVRYITNAQVFIDASGLYAEINNRTPNIIYTYSLYDATVFDLESQPPKPHLMSLRVYTEEVRKVHLLNT